ncbi:hypothetical protein HQ560_08295 [bacterium]|nr:hypothetical protein [bacterium]
MKIEALAYIVAGEALALLEQKYHYRIAEEHKKDIQNTIQIHLNDYIKRSVTEAPPED